MDSASARSVTISTLCHATEERSKVLKAVRELLSGAVSKDSPASKVKGHYGNEIVTAKTVISSRREADRFFRETWRRLPESERKLILSRLDDHIDTQGTLFLRVDKEESFEGRVRIGTYDTLKVEVHFTIDTRSHDLAASIEELIALF